MLPSVENTFPSITHNNLGGWTSPEEKSHNENGYLQYQAEAELFLQICIPIMYRSEQVPYSRECLGKGKGGRE